MACKALSLLRKVKLAAYLSSVLRKRVLSLRNFYNFELLSKLLVDLVLEAYL